MNKFLLTCFLFLALSENLAAQGIVRPDSMFPPADDYPLDPSNKSAAQAPVASEAAKQDSKNSPSPLEQNSSMQQSAQSQESLLGPQAPENIALPQQTIPPQMMMPPQQDFLNQQDALQRAFQKSPVAATTKVENDKKSLALFDAKKPTPSRFFTADISMPDHFSTSNNLAKKVGSFYRAFGEVIFIRGTVTDSFGVPIEGAIIEIWQTNSAGRYHTLLDPDSEYVDKYFNMSGRAVSDNVGAYDFITIMPGASSGRAPHINMNIYHPKFGKIETEMYFSEHPYNSSDYQYLAYSADDRKLLTATVRRSNLSDRNSIKICTFNIVMRGVHQYKTY